MPRQVTSKASVQNVIIYSSSSFRGARIMIITNSIHLHLSQTPTSNVTTPFFGLNCCRSCENLPTFHLVLVVWVQFVNPDVVGNRFPQISTRVKVISRLGVGLNPKISTRWKIVSYLSVFLNSHSFFGNPLGLLVEHLSFDARSKKMSRCTTMKFRLSGVRVCALPRPNFVWGKLNFQVGYIMYILHINHTNSWQNSQDWNTLRTALWKQLRKKVWFQ